MNYHDKQFKVMTNSDQGEIPADLIFHYQQFDNLLHCSYQGGNILLGHLLGTVQSDGRIFLNYHQINAQQEIKTGVCTSTPEILPNGKIRLHESWQWTSGDKSKGHSVLEEI